jgi:hypothetical protein
LPLLYHFNEVTHPLVECSVKTQREQSNSKRPHLHSIFDISSRQFLNILARDVYVAFMLPARFKPAESTLFGGSSHQRAGCRAHHKLEVLHIIISCAKNRDYEHVAFLKLWCRKNVTKKCIRTSESSRCARRSRVTASTRNNPASSSAEHLSTTSALGRLDYSRQAPHLPRSLRALPAQFFSRTTTTLARSHDLIAPLAWKPERATRMQQQRHA